MNNNNNINRPATIVKLKKLKYRKIWLILNQLRRSRVIALGLVIVITCLLCTGFIEIYLRFILIDFVANPNPDPNVGLQQNENVQESTAKTKISQIIKGNDLKNTETTADSKISLRSSPAEEIEISTSITTDPFCFVESPSPSPSPSKVKLTSKKFKSTPKIRRIIARTSTKKSIQTLPISETLETDSGPISVIDVNANTNTYDLSTSNSSGLDKYSSSEAVEEEEVIVIPVVETMKSISIAPDQLKTDLNLIESEETVGLESKSNNEAMDDSNISDQVQILLEDIQNIDNMNSLQPTDSNQSSPLIYSDNDDDDDYNSENDSELEEDEEIGISPSSTESSLNSTPIGFYSPSSITYSSSNLHTDEINGIRHSNKLSNPINLLNRLDNYPSGIPLETMSMTQKEKYEKLFEESDLIPNQSDDDSSDESN